MSVIVNIAGVPKIGTSYVAESVARELKKKDLKVQVLKFKTAKELARWETLYLIGRCQETDVFIIDKHPIVAKMANKRLTTNRFSSSNVEMDLTFLLTCEPEDLKHRMGEEGKVVKRFSLRHQLAYHENMENERYYSNRVKMIDTSGKMGLLWACGQVRDEILRELRIFK